MSSSMCSSEFEVPDEADMQSASFNGFLHFSFGDLFATGVDEVSLLNVSTFCIFALMIAPAAHEEHVKAFAPASGPRKLNVGYIVEQRHATRRGATGTFGQGFCGGKAKSQYVRDRKSSICFRLGSVAGLRTCASCDNCDPRSGGGAVGR